MLQCCHPARCTNPNLQREGENFNYSTKAKQKLYSHGQELFYVQDLESKNSLDAGIQDSSTSISIVVKVEQPLLKEKMVMKVTNIYKHEIVDTRG